MSFVCRRGYLLLFVLYGVIQFGVTAGLSADTLLRHAADAGEVLSADASTHEPAEDISSGPTKRTSIPSPRCANREEWRGESRSWSGEPHNRYIELTRVAPAEGIGASLLRVAWVLHRAIAFDLEPVFDGPFIACHGTGNFGEWVGFKSNTFVAVQDPTGLEGVEKQHVPLPLAEEVSWFQSQMNRTSVLFVPNIMEVTKAQEWGVPVSPPPSNAGVCPSPGCALRSIFWSVPKWRQRCRAALAQQWQPEEGSEAVPFLDLEHSNLEGRPWVVGVHVRRGDMISFRGGVRSIPHAYFVAVLNSVLGGIAAADPGARVTILVFSEGPSRLPEQQKIVDEHGSPVVWDIAQDTCEPLGVRCIQEIIFDWTAPDTLDCLATVDIVVGSESSMSEAAAALSTNVKVMLWKGQHQQDRITLDSVFVASNGAVSSESQVEINLAIANWRYCLQEAGSSLSNGALATAARTFYQTVDG